MKINGGVALIEEVPDCHEVIRQIRLFTRPKNIEFCPDKGGMYNKGVPSVA